MKDELKNVETDINKVYYIVNLAYGDVTIKLIDIITPGPFKICKSIEEANLYSLNVLRQNAIETEIKVGSKPKTQAREFLGNSQVIETIKIVPTMNWIKKTFLEKFI